MIRGFHFALLQREKKKINFKLHDYNKKLENATNKSHLKDQNAQAVEKNAF